MLIHELQAQHVWDEMHGMSLHEALYPSNSHHALPATASLSSWEPRGLERQ